LDCFSLSSDLRESVSAIFDYLYALSVQEIFSTPLLLWRRRFALVYGLLFALLTMGF
jgi:hypothetical protein